MLGFLRIVKFALQDIGRNFSLSFMTVLILVLMLLSINTLVSVRLLTEEAIAAIKKQIDVSVYFSPEAKDEEIREVRDYVGAFPEVTETTYLDKNETLSKFREAYKENTKIVSSLDELGTNPLGATLIIKTRETQDYGKIITALSVPEYENIIEAKTFGDTQKAIEKIHTVTTQVERFTLFLTTLFAVISFIIIFNTVRVAIYTQRVEISIKKLVGATNWFVRGPYIIESLIFSVLSVLISFVLLYFSVRFIDPYITVMFQKPLILTNYLKTHILELVSLQFAAVLFLTTITSFLAMRKYLKV